MRRPRAALAAVRLGRGASLVWTAPLKQERSHSARSNPSFAGSLGRSTARGVRPIPLTAAIKLRSVPLACRSTLQIDLSDANRIVQAQQPRGVPRPRPRAEPLRRPAPAARTAPAITTPQPPRAHAHASFGLAPLTGPHHRVARTGARHRHGPARDGMPAERQAAPRQPAPGPAGHHRAGGVGGICGRAGVACVFLCVLCKTKLVTDRARGTMCLSYTGRSVI